MTRSGFAAVLRVTVESDLTIARQLLAAAGLPTADLRLDHLALIAEKEGVVAGLIGLEQFKKTGLLTIDADKWFASLGYLTQSRDSAPAAIQSTAEFSSLCPGDAVLMKKLLAA